MQPPSHATRRVHSAMSESRASSFVARPPARPFRILVVDDEPAIRDVLTAYLQEHGHEVVTAVHGAEALEIFAQREWDLVMTDGLMPEMSGTEFAREIKRRNPSVPVFLVSGSSEMLHEASDELSPIDFIIRKPFTRDLLGAALARVSAAAQPGAPG
jgi:CheY-like chemotaxis protein